MYPESPPPNYPIDYLNQIAVQPQKTGPNKKFILIFIGLGVAALIVGSLALFSTLSTGPTNDLQRLAARLTTLKKVTTDAQKNIKSSDLRSINGGLTITLSNASNQIEEPLANNNIKISQIDKAITQQESADDLTTKLEDARLNGRYDTTYSREMGYQLGLTRALMGKIYDSTSSKSVKTFIDTTDENIKPLKQQFDQFSPQS